MTHQPPTFAIIVPTFGRPQQLATCLQSFAVLDYPHDCFEVLVVDDGSSAPPDSVVQSFRNQLDIRLLTQVHAGPAAARNTGAARAEAQFLAFTDDDCTVSADWLQTLANRFSLLPPCAIGGRIQNALPDNPYSTASQLLVSYLYTYYNAVPDHAQFCTSNNLAVATELFHTVGGFDSRWMWAAGEDREFCDRWLFYGHQLVYVPEVVVFHAHPLSLRTFWRQHFTYGRGAYYFHAARAQRNQASMRIEPLQFYWHLLRSPFALWPHGRALVISSLLLIAQLANTAGFFVERRSAQRHLKNSIPTSAESLRPQ